MYLPQNMTGLLNLFITYINNISDKEIEQARLSERPPASPLKLFQCPSDWQWPLLAVSGDSVQRFVFRRCCHPAHAIDGVTSVALCPQVVSQLPQRTRHVLRLRTINRKSHVRTMPRSGRRGAIALLTLFILPKNKNKTKQNKKQNKQHSRGTSLQQIKKQ